MVIGEFVKERLAVNAQRVVRERVALAGYRLAELLNELFK